MPNTGIFPGPIETGPGINGPLVDTGMLKYSAAQPGWGWAPSSHLCPEQQIQPNYTHRTIDPLADDNRPNSSDLIMANAILTTRKQKRPTRLLDTKS